MTSRQNRKGRRAAERTNRNRQPNNSALSASVARQDEAALLSEPKTQEQDEAALLSEPKTQEQDEAALLSEPKTQEQDEAALLSEPKTQENDSTERTAHKLIQPNTPESEPCAPTSEPVSPARLAANRANAQLSTGPKTESGKIKSSKNALKTALTGRTVLLPEDDADRYEQHLHAYKKAYQPVGERECELVQSLADTTWRLDRIPGLEEALYARGCNEFAADVAGLDPRARVSTLRMQTYLAYERQFRNLNIQEMRLHRLREKLIAEVKELQKEREQKEKEDLAIAAKLYIAAKHDRKPFNPAEYGFEFSTADVEGYLQGQRASLLAEKAFSSASQ